MKTAPTIAIGLALAAVLVSQAEKRPNIIFLMADDQSTYTLGCYGNPDVQTPNIDQLASDGIAFDNHYDTTAICMASRATVMTGMYEYKTGCNFSHGDMLKETWQKSYPMLLREAGYMTAFAGKFGFDLKDGPEGKRLPLPAPDFDRWGGGPGQTNYETAKNKSMAAYAGEYPHSTLSYGAFGRDFIRDAAKAGKPFSLSISFKAPHKPASPDPRFDDVYAGKTFTKPANYGRENGEHFSRQSQHDRQYERFHSWNYSDQYDEVMATYHQQIHAIDVAVGMIRQALEEHGVAGNTVIIYTSDNGFFCGSHGYGSKVLPYEESSRVPMIMFDPRHPNSGKKLRSKGLTGNIDFAPTILKLAGLPAPANMDGGDLTELYANPKGDIHDALSLINVWGKPATHALAVVTKEMKYIHWGYAAEGFEVTEELYHLGKDPLELVNQAGNPEYRQALETLRKTYDARLAHWKAEAVPYHNYQPYGTIFDRHVPWAEKETQARTKGKKKK
ncbi:Arylsulfatase [Pontiella desulfatans]|uniref:Arylsulfatase n=1 Tax=Pontiella desulfatans TaxID=2750659 RepID=A0A6C2UDW6_PONDE|nr:sulfatase [Pontiella desulfatans]SPS74094.1 sulfatase S1_25 [Kiritimatiellales bacterium]VGO17611.1 Arylsulfatase [Pontiella desulfatans]